MGGEAGLLAVGCVAARPFALLRQVAVGSG